VGWGSTVYGPGNVIGGGPGHGTGRAGLVVVMAVGVKVVAVVVVHSKRGSWGRFRASS
jgi:hypothetical protein